MGIGIRVLLVEDDIQDTHYICEILGFPDNHAYHIQVADRIANAIALANSNVFDVILTDLNLPDSSGLSSLTSLLDFYPNVPIVVLTGLDDMEVGKNAVQQGAQDFLFKSEIEGGALKRSLMYAIERKKIKDSLEETSSLKELLLDVLTHDLKNTAGSIQGLSNVMLSEYPLNEIARTINDTSEKLLKVIENTSTLARISSREEIELKCLDLCEILNEVLSEFEDSLKIKDMNIDFTPCKEAMVYANPIIAEVFKNYISNALRYGKDGQWIHVDFKLDKDTVLVRISDYGAIIPEEDREKIFNRRMQLNQNKKMGSGLGLAIVKRIAEMHQGRVWVEPYQSQGNSFCLELEKV